MEHLDKPEVIAQMLAALRAGFMNRYIESTMHIVPGVRVLAQRHHSEEIKLTVR
jgi:hypothetical protein